MQAWQIFFFDWKYKSENEYCTNILSFNTMTDRDGNWEPVPNY